jgi:hypothetical protein
MSVVGMEANSSLMSVYPLLLQPQINFFPKEPDPDSHLHVQTRIKIVLIYFLKPKLEALHKRKELPKHKTLGCILIGA